MPCGKDSSSVMAFTTTKLSIDQMVSWIGFYLIVYGSIACAWGRIVEIKRIFILIQGRIGLAIGILVQNMKFTLPLL